VFQGDEAPRYTAGPLPARRYLPGRGPHPSTDPAHEEPRSPGVPWPELGRTELFRRGVDLFNHGFFWESHEAWEALWLECPEGSALRAGLQGLIQLAAALLKEEVAIPEGARKLSRTAIEKLARARDGRAPLPLDLGRVIEESRAHFAPLDDPAAPASPRPLLLLSH
jgi:hypothetical protein